MTFQENIKHSFNVLRLNEDAMDELANDKNATLWGVLTLVIVGVASAISTKSIFAVMISPIFVLVLFALTLLIYHGIAKLIGGTATWPQYFRCMSGISVLYWLVAIPYLGWIVQMVGGIWTMVVHMHVLHKIHELSWLKSILLVLLPSIIFTILVVLLVIGFASYMGTLAPIKLAGASMEAVLSVIK